MFLNTRLYFVSRWHRGRSEHARCVIGLCIKELFIYLLLIFVNFRKSFASSYLTNLFSSLCKYENSWYDRKLRTPHWPVNFTKIAVLLCKNLAKRIISRATEEGSPSTPPPPHQKKKKKKKEEEEEDTVFIFILFLSLFEQKIHSDVEDLEDLVEDGNEEDDVVDNVEGKGGVEEDVEDVEDVVDDLGDVEDVHVIEKVGGEDDWDLEVADEGTKVSMEGKYFWNVN